MRAVIELVLHPRKNLWINYSKISYDTYRIGLDYYD